jgi:hypothetical protein
MNTAILIHIIRYFHVPDSVAKGAKKYSVGSGKSGADFFVKFITRAAKGPNYV